MVNKTRVLIMGSGKMAIASALDLEKDQKVERITLTGRDQRSLENSRKKAKTEKIDAVKVDCTDISSISLMKKYDVGIGALPHSASVPALKNAIKAGLSVVDMVFEEEQWDLDGDAKKAGVTIIPGFGVHPGIAGAFVGHAYNELDKTERVFIRCGGLPEPSVLPNSPLNHRTAFNIYSALGEYAKEAQVIEDGKLRTVEPMTEIEKIHHPKLGDMECFITGTGATLLRTLKGVREFKSKTIRWPGNVNSMKLLVDCGLLSDEEMEIHGMKITPKEMFISIIQPKFILGEGKKELTYLEVDVEGYRGNVLKKYRYELLDYYDEKEGLTSMARTTGYPPAIAARMIADRQIEQKGVVPPEKIFIGEKFEHLMRELSKRGISIETKQTSIEERKF